MYEIYKNGEKIAIVGLERDVVMFLFGVNHGGNSMDAITDYVILKNGNPILKTLLVEKYFPKV